jgi:hypothetical protein
MALGSRREGDEMRHVVLVSASIFWSDCSRIGRRQPSKATLSSANLIGTDDFWAQDLKTSWHCKGSPTFPSAF